jgi:hypothetical protein
VISQHAHQNPGACALLLVAGFSKAAHATALKCVATCKAHDATSRNETQRRMMQDATRRRMMQATTQQRGETADDSAPGGLCGFAVPGSTLWEFSAANSAVTVTGTSLPTSTRRSTWRRCSASCSVATSGVATSTVATYTVATYTVAARQTRCAQHHATSRSGNRTASGCGRCRTSRGAGGSDGGRARHARVGGPRVACRNVRDRRRCGLVGVRSRHDGAPHCSGRK